MNICNIIFFLLIFWNNSVEGKRYYKTLRFQVPVDHFSFANNNTFNIKYLYNDTFWDKENGPIFFYTGNEGTIELFTEHTGFMWDIAPEFNALLVFAEHRYYGDSMPFGNKSLSSLEYSGYLTSQQALADYADLITFLQKDRENPSPVIVFGGSYGGMLSAYFRMKYPHLANGAIAASAPIFQFKNLIPCDAFYRIITASFALESNVCVDNIKKSWKTIRDLLSSADGKKWLSNEWHLCKPINTDNVIQKLIDWLQDAFTTLAMVNYPYDCDFMLPLPAYPVKQFCISLANSSLSGKPLLTAMYKGLNVFAKNKQSCIDYEGGTENPNLGDNAWDFQSCTEMVMPMCTTGKFDMFENVPWNENDFTAKCKAKWGVTPSYNLAQKEFGGKNIESASNIVFSNGLLDPWTSGGVLKSQSKLIYPILIPEGAHHLDLMGTNANDPASVKIARQFHKTMIKKWINRRQESNFTL